MKKEKKQTTPTPEALKRYNDYMAARERNFAARDGKMLAPGHPPRDVAPIRSEHSPPVKRMTVKDKIRARKVVPLPSKEEEKMEDD